MTQSLKDARVVVMGLGRFGGGVGVTRFLIEQGARVLVTDMAEADELEDSLNALAGLEFEQYFGGHREKDFANADLVIVNPAVDRRTNVYLQAATAAGVPLTSEIELLIERLPSRERTIGITGSAGKSTTTAMIGHILADRYGPDRVHVGGNIGGSLLPKLTEMAEEDWVVLELSSFMLDAMDGWSPHIAVATNLTENHLDRHCDMAEYEAAKAEIVLHQTADDVAILGPDFHHWMAAGRAIRMEKPESYELLIPGEHNQWNATMAVAAAVEAGVERAAAAASVASFAGLPHRLQLVCEHNGRRFFNDSKSTTPEAAMRALDCFERQSVHLILGGYDKKADLSELAHHAAEYAAAVYTIGETGAAIADLIDGFVQSQGYWAKLYRCETLDVAVEECVRHAKAGQVVLLSPGCASWDQFPHFEERGRSFAEYALRFQTET